MAGKKLVPSHDMMVRIQAAFYEFGYDTLSMVSLADACKFTRRALYHYFSNKEEAFRCTIQYFNDVSMADGLAAGSVVRERGGGALDILAEIINVRYGETRRGVSKSRHLIELNGEAFRRCHDIMVDVAIRFNADLAEVIRDLASDGMLYLRPGLSPAVLAQLLTDGARGVNQSRPPIKAEEFAFRYRQMTEAILFGCALQRIHGTGAVQREAGTGAAGDPPEIAGPSPGGTPTIHRRAGRHPIARR
jgi:AcrR family transcriptional regulator